MARPSKPFWWAARGGWYATIRGTRHLLAKGEQARAEADRRFHQLMAQDPEPATPAPADIRTDEILIR